MTKEQRFFLITAVAALAISIAGITHEMMQRAANEQKRADYLSANCVFKGTRVIGNGHTIAMYDCDGMPREVGMNVHNRVRR